MDQMDDDQYSAVVKSLIDQAADDTAQVEDDRVRYTNVYNGEKYGDEVAGRSQIVTREARDTVRQMMPSIMRILTGAEQPCRFHATRQDMEQEAQQATAYVRHIFENDNDGYSETWTAVEDALVRQTGVFKVWFDESEVVESVDWQGLALDEYQAIEADEDITLTEITEYPGDPETGEPPTYDIEGTRVESEGRIRFAAIPPEEFIAINGRSSADSPLVGHRRSVTYSDLREMGYSEEQLDDENITWGDSDDTLGDEARQARDPQDDTTDEASSDPSQKVTEFVEAYVRIDHDGDGIAELRKICTVGSGRVILEDELSDGIDLIDFTAWPRAHTLYGESQVGLVEDLQKISTNITRNTLNSLARATNPDLMAVEGMVNLDDAMSSEAGKIIRVKNPEALQELTYRFVGGDTLPMLDRLDRLGEKRTGITAASQGLDADSMQSTTEVAVNATQRAALGQVELLTRNIVQTGFIKLYKLILRMAIRYQNKPRAIKIAGSWQLVDPKYWDSEMHVRPAQALGAGSEEQRVASLNRILEKQEQIIQVGGIDNNPLITAQHYYNTLYDLTVLSGFRDPERYFRDPSTFQPQPQEPQPDPDMIKAQADAEKKQAEIQDIQAARQQEQQRIQLEYQKAMMTEQRLTEQNSTKMALEYIKAQEAAGRQVDLQQLQMMLQQADSAADRELRERMEIMRQAANMQMNEERMKSTNNGANGNE